jgi:hypothetical protein
MTDFEFSAGLLVRGPARRFLEEAQWHKELTEWKEIKSLLGSRFLIRGATPAVISALTEWAESIQSRNA